MKDAIELHYGKCRIKRFCRVTHAGELNSRCLNTKSVECPFNLLPIQINLFLKNRVEKYMKECGQMCSHIFL